MPDNLTAPPATPEKTTRREYLRLSGPDRKRLQRRASTAYTSGDSIRAIAAATGYAYTTIHRVLTDAGVTLRGRGHRHTRPDKERMAAASARQVAGR